MTKPSINWDHVAPEFVVMATDGDGSSWLYRKIPMPMENKCRWHDIEWVDAILFSSFTPGTCDWRDSLVIRPGYEETGE